MNFETPMPNELFSRRELLLRGGGGFGAVALSGMFARDKALAGNATPAGRAHFAPRAKNVIFLFMEGGRLWRDWECAPPEAVRQNGTATQKSKERR